MTPQRLTELEQALPDSAEVRPRCEACRFWERIDVDSVYPDDATTFSDDGLVEQGYCKRYPPTIVSDVLATVRNLPLYLNRFKSMTPSGMLHSASVWPVTWDFDSCGEWKPIPAASEEERT